MSLRLFYVLLVSFMFSECVWGKGSESVFVENQVYKVKFIQYGDSGAATIVRKGSKFYMTLPIAIYGASLYGRTSAEEVLKQTGHKSPASWYKTGAKSFNDIPDLKAAVIEFCKGIEKVFDTDFFNLKMELQFSEDEYAFLKLGKKQTLKNRGGNENNYSSSPTAASFHSAIQDTDSMTNLIGAVFTPNPNLVVATPGIWDILISQPYLMAHELMHSLGVTTEGFLYPDYPPNGIMSDETNYNSLKRLAPEIERKLLLIDFNTLMVGDGLGFSQPLIKRIEPQIDTERAILEFSPTNGALRGRWPKDQWANLSQIDRRAMVDKNVAEWVPKLRRDPTCQRLFRSLKAR